MNPFARVRRSLAQRGLGGTFLQAPRAAVRPLVLAIRTRRSAARAPRLLREAAPALLHLGSGPERLPGWINVDLYFPAELCFDLRRPLPLPDACVEAIYSQHLIEHLDQAAGSRLVRECARVLKPGGWLRCATPDLGQYVKLYRGELGDLDEHLVAHAGATGRERATPADVLNDIMRAHDHLYLYDFAALADLFTSAGLTEVYRAAPQESRCPLLCRRETRLTDVGEGPVLDLIVEGRR
jgi:predicted SAM-dependent methyltransferase